ncbi:hypothetical protein [Tissierella praeacuta]|uniref:hypothetical protein n=1 Tax=Tissierella praeacuta TaxID=43131 RepID=UPI00333F0918
MKLNMKRTTLVVFYTIITFILIWTFKGNKDKLWEEAYQKGDFKKMQSHLFITDRYDEDLNKTIEKFVEEHKIEIKFIYKDEIIKYKSDFDGQIKEEDVPSIFLIDEGSIKDSLNLQEYRELDMDEMNKELVTYFEVY